MLKLVQLILVTAFAAAASAAPVTIQEQQQGQVTVSITCCDEDDESTKWPLALIVPVGGFIWWQLRGDNDLTDLNVNQPPVMFEPFPGFVPHSSEPTEPVPELPSFMGLLLGFVLLYAAPRLRGRLVSYDFLALLRGSRRRGLILFSVVSAMMLLGVVAEAKPRYGIIHLETSPKGMPFAIDGKLAGVSTDAATELKLSPGWHVIKIFLPDNTSWSKRFEVFAGRVCWLELSYRPPTSPPAADPCPTCIPERARKVFPDVPEPKRPPALVMRRFDTCCACRFNDLKARLDALVIELNREPSSRALLRGPGLQRSRDYLVHSRGLDAKRIIMTAESSFPSPACVELWILPL